jgi:hypothetical protein
MTLLKDKRVTKSARNNTIGLSAIVPFLASPLKNDPEYFTPHQDVG